MHKNNVLWFIIGIVIVLVSPVSNGYGSGFGLNEHSARVMGIGGAFTGIADSPSAIFFNPAGIAALNGLEMEAGVTMITPGISLSTQIPGTESEAEINAVRNYFWIPNIHMTYRLNNWLVGGIGLYAPYGLGTEWAKQVEINGQTQPWWGRPIVNRLLLQTFNITPTLGIEVHPRILIGGGISIIRGLVELERSVTFSSKVEEDVNVELAGDDWSIGSTAGVLFKVIPDFFNVGLAFRSGASLAFDGNAAFTRNGSSSLPPSIRATLTDSRARAYLDLPHVFSLGLASFPIDDLSVGFSVDVVNWHSYDELKIDFLDNENLNVEEPKHWNNTVSVRLGTEYYFMSNIPLRIGFVFDQSPIPSTTLGPELPDGNRWEISLGGGYRFEDFRLDLAYQHIFTGETASAETSPLKGIYHYSVHLVGMSLAYRMNI